jgi:uncharacterized coiled-coil protein SlyX
MMFPTRISQDRISPDNGSLDPRAVRRALTGLRDRLRLQEDELDTLRELIRKTVSNGSQPAPVPAPAPVPVQMPAPPSVHPDELQARLDELRAEISRVDTLEAQLAEQSKMLQEAFSVMGRTDTNLRRLVSQVDRLLGEVARRPDAPPNQIEVTAEPAVVSAGNPHPRGPQIRDPRSRERSSMFTAVDDLEEFEDTEAPRFRWKFPLAILAVLSCVLAGVWYGYFRDTVPMGTVAAPIDQARSYENEKNFPKAEEIYRDLLAKDPTNVEVIRHLASVLYREDKVDESAEVLKKLKN